MKIKIFNCHYQDTDHTFSDETYATLISGRRTAPDGRYLGDLDGDNIATRNIFSEVRHQYFVWKNMVGQYDYVGFEHYRRVFFFDLTSADHLRQTSESLFQARVLFAGDYRATHHDVPIETFRTYEEMRKSRSPADDDALRKIISQYDIMIPRPPENGGLERQWKACAPADIWDKLIAALARDQRLVRYLGAPIMSAVFNNMFIMKWSIFDEYMTLMMETLRYLDGTVGELNRIYGHLAERILNFFIFSQRMDHPALQVGHQPVLTCMTMDRVIMPNELTATDHA